MIKNYLLGAVLAAMTLLGLWGRAGADDERVAKLMREKLERSQKILEALALEDYAAIAKNADQLGVLSQAAAWNVLQTPEYASHSADFLRLSQKLARMAREKNLDGATLAYVELTINCVACHRHVRSVKTAGVDDDFSKSLARSAAALQPRR
jgi:hypothetical protein